MDKMWHHSKPKKFTTTWLGRIIKEQIKNRRTTNNDIFRIQYCFYIDIKRGICKGTHMVSQDRAFEVQPCTKTKTVIETYPYPQ